MNTKDAINIINNSNNTIYNNIDLIHLDSRHTEAAYILTQEALKSSTNQHSRSSTNQQPPLITIDVEKDRPPYLSYILPLCDIIFTNETFTESYSRISKNTTNHVGRTDNTDLSMQQYVLFPTGDSGDTLDLNKL